MGAFTVLDTLDSYNLGYQCPPDGYNGVAPECNGTSNTQLAILHLNTSDEKLYAIEVILSGAPFPPVGNLQDNQPPFGPPQHISTEGVSIASNGYLQICENTSSNQCPNRNINANHPI